MIIVPVCLACQREMKVEKNGVTVVEMAYDPPEPYNVYKADLYKCPECDTEAVRLSSAFWHNGDDRTHLPDINDEWVYPIYER